MTMRSGRKVWQCAAALTLAMGMLCASPAGAQVSDTAWTYQGRLEQAGVPANGVFDLRLTPYFAPTDGSAAAPTVCIDDLSVTDGLVNTTVDFGAAFNDFPVYLEVQVRPGAVGTCASGAGFTTLAPRTPMTVAPRAAFARDAARLGNFPAISYARRDVGNSFSAINNFLADVNLVNPTTTIGFPALPTGTVSSPMIEMFSAGTNNATRMVIGHSPTFATWGIEYNDVADQFNFRGGNATPALAVSLPANRVGVNVVSPTQALEVGGTVAADNFIRRVPQTRTLVLGPADFVQWQGNYNPPSASSCWICSETATLYLDEGVKGTFGGGNRAFNYNASVRLPAGSTITGVTMYVLDQSTANDICAVLLRSDVTNVAPLYYFNTGNTTRSPVCTAGGSLSTRTLTIPGAPMVVGPTDAVALIVKTNSDAGSQLMNVFGAVVTYTTTEP